MTRRERQRIYNIKEQGAAWTRQQNFWLFGTCTYVDSTAVTRQQCVRNAQRFFNNLDRSVLGRRLYRDNSRLPRLVYVETGRFRVNTHIHFYISGYAWQHYRRIWETAEELWGEQIDCARDCVVQDNLGAHRVNAGYCWKEFDGLSAETLLTECCYLPTRTELH